MEEKILVKGKFIKPNPLSLGCWIFAAYTLCASIYVKIQDPYDEIVGIVISFSIIVILIGVLIQVAANKCELIVKDKRVYGKSLFGKRVDLPIDMISSVDQCAFKGVGVATASGRIKFLFLDNKVAVFNSISNLLLERQERVRSQETKPVVQEIKQSSADELKKFKELLDVGVITQEEFEQKKKQLLDL